MKNLPIGIQSFESLRREDFVYVDKTKLIYELIRVKRPYFFSRPRRFGKSLLCSTFEAIFRGRRDLFKDLWIDQSNYDWKEYPVILLNIASLDLSSPQTLLETLQIQLSHCAREYNVPELTNNSVKQNFIDLVQELSIKAPVAILIDEYDKPIINNLTNIARAQEMRDTLKNFYGALKDLDKYIKFLFITGVSKFARTSIFSDLNHLVDLSLDESTATLCGYTQTEIDQNFVQHREAVIKKRGIPADELRQEIKNWYNGYRFEENQTDPVYNPFSILNFFNTGKFENYWFQSGSPTFLIEKIKEQQYPVTHLEDTLLTCAAMDVYDLDNMDLKVLLFQTGYLTIKPGSKTNRLLTVGIPNEEVRLSLFEQFAHMMTDYAYDEAPNTVELSKKSILKNS